MTARARHPGRVPARRATDRYIGWGFFGIHLVATLTAVRLAFFAAVPQWHDKYWAAVMFVAGLLPLYAAIGIYRYTHHRSRRPYNGNRHTRGEQ